METTHIKKTEVDLICLVTEMRKEFLRRRQKNTAYSMRAFSKYLGLDQSLLSKILTGKRALSNTLVSKIVPKLDIKPSQVERLLQRPMALQNFSYQDLDDDQISLLGEWQHFAILELAKTKDFKSDNVWIANRLNLHKEEVRDALERLERTGFISFELGRIRLLKPNNQWNNTVATSKAKQNLQKTVLQQSMEALENVDFSKRDHGSVTVAVRKDRIPEFKEKLKQIRDDLDQFFQPVHEEKEFDEVYQLAISFFPITQNLKTK